MPLFDKVRTQLADFATDPAAVMLYVLLAIVCAMGLAQRFSRSRARRFWSGRVTGVEGRKGGGKSLFSVWQAYRQLAFPVTLMEGPLRGRRTYGHLAANFTMDVSGVRRRRGLRMGPPPVPECMTVRSWEDVLLLPPYTLCLIDEAALWVPARAGQVLPIATSMILKQLRKLDIELVWLDQDMMNVAEGLRRQTDFMAECRNLGSYHKCEVYDRRHYPPRMGVKPLWRMRYRRSAKWLAMYDSKTLLRPAEDVSITEEAQRLTELMQARRSPRASGGAAPAVPPSTIDGSADRIMSN